MGTAVHIPYDRKMNAAPRFKGLAFLPPERDMFIRKSPGMGRLGRSKDCAKAEAKAEAKAKVKVGSQLTSQQGFAGVESRIAEDVTDPEQLIVLRYPICTGK